MTDVRTQARELTAGTEALKAWVDAQVASNKSLNGLQKQAIGRIPLSMYGEIVTVIRDAIDGVRDNPELPL